ncbi:hypothetical protein NQ315_001359 [Exocentrus adspersus]|uniref:Fibronectin type-III domain-containing protein n=1 Tax=Exocentrus adspersus TaxID=1586481 RepID=A0AAV8WF71_9CUCU|nr:hypothetical protein NQ315_001359 [Exocentrus adspersus]
MESVTTTTWKICASVLLVFFAIADGVEAQECVANSVENVTLSAYHILSWEVSKNETCVITQFLVHIYERGQSWQYSFEVGEPEADVSFLEVCQEWVFLIVPISNHTRGREHHFYASIPLPWNADLSIAYINVTRNGVTNDLYVTWDLANRQFGTCTIRYRVTIEEEDSPDIHDLYMSDRSLNIQFLSPCTKYQIGVRAINIAHPTIEGTLMSKDYEFPAAKQEPPKLQTVELGVTSFNMTWALEPRKRNRCEVEEFFVSGEQYFNISVVYDDKPDRHHVNLTIGNLRPSSMYYMHASVRNSAGWSVHTIVSVQTLEASESIPAAVQNVAILSNSTLLWELDAFEICDVTNFHVDVTGGGMEEYHYVVDEKYLDLSFLTVCDQWDFIVTAVAHDVVGVATTLSTYVPLPPDADLTISSFGFTSSEGETRLYWQLSNRTYGDCSLEYRLTRRDLDRGTIEDMYVEGNTARLDSMSLCVEYELLLRAVNMAFPPTEGPLTSMTLQLSGRPQTAPRLKLVINQATSFHMTWELEGDANRCPLRTLLVDGGIYFNSSVSLQDLDDVRFADVEIKSLRPGTMYHLNVSVQNSRGWSAATPVAVQTLDLSPN